MADAGEMVVAIGSAALAGLQDGHESPVRALGHSDGVFFYLSRSGELRAIGALGVHANAAPILATAEAD